MHLEPRLFLRIGSKTEVEISGLTLAGGREGISNFGYLTVSATARFPTTSVIGRDSELIVHLTLIRQHDFREFEELWRKPEWWRDLE